MGKQLEDFLKLSEDEAAAVDEGLAQLDRGEFASDEEVKALWWRFGVK